MAKKNYYESGKQIIAEAKKEVKEKDGHMKKLDWKTIITVSVTLLAVAALVGAFLGGMSYQKSIDERVKSEAKALVSSK